MYESLASFAIFCGDSFENKVEFIFKLFDFDKSGTLENAELVLTLQSAIRGLCKLVHIECPTLKFLEEVSQSIFVLIDNDNNKKISSSEFFFWIKNNHDLQDFLLKYANTQTFENLQRRYKFIALVFSNLFTNAAGGPEYPTAPEEALRKLVETEGKDYLKSEDLDFLFNLLRQSTVTNSGGKITEKDKMIGRTEWNSVMNTWSAFSASDINNDNSVNIVELKTLIWVYEGEEPSEHRVSNEMKEIDADKSGFIDRFEWVKNFCAPDKNGKIIFRANIKALFEKYDKDNSGYLNLDEIQGLMREAFKDYTNRCKDSETKTRLLEMIDQLTKEIFMDLDESGDKSLSWPEFRKFLEVSIGKQDKLKKFLDSTL